MKIVLTGGTGYIGSALLEQLVAAGHAVTALVRSDEAAVKVRKAGAEPVVGDLFDTPWLATRFSAADGVVHTAATGDATSEQFDRSVVGAAVQALAGTGKPYVHTSGIWIYGDNAEISEDSPFSAPALTAWRQPVEQSVLDADLVATIVTPAVVYGHGGGIPGGVLTPARDEAGRIRLVGDGSQHWTTVHVEDVAALYAAVVERGERLGYVIVASGDNPTVRELAEAAAGDAGVAPESADASRERLGALFADALLLDQQATAVKARALGWTPTRPSLVEELRTGSYTR
jgi:nucleoside-diphosphate-sugar epimerase